MDELAKELNQLLIKNKTILNLLSIKGKEIYYPTRGILSQTKEASGKEINATIGMAFDEEKQILCLDSIKKNVLLTGEETFAYAPSFGLEELRKKWASEIIKKNPSIKSQISLPIVTSALTHALSIIGFLFVNEGDEIIVPDLFWGNYKFIFEKWFGTKLKTFQTFDQEGNFNISEFASVLSQGNNKKIILLNFPNNPTGYTPTNVEADQIVKIIKDTAERGKEILCIIDDAYFDLVYEENIIKESIFAQLANIHENVLAVKLDGATKEYYAWGLRVGFITYGTKNVEGTQEIYSVLEAKTAGAIRGNISNAPRLSQSLLLKALNDSSLNSEKEKNYLLLKKRYENVKEVLSNEKYAEYFIALPFNSGYFMCIQIKEIDAEEVRKKLLENYSTGVIAIGDKIRIAYSAISTKSIEQLFENIYLSCKELRK
ncbi:MAG: aminotransferase class I/II-fold pyridoxal phosphate-dependent enzyme [archaeon]|jgi:aspartate/methionine/tyrosine aminotransferase